MNNLTPEGLSLSDQLGIQANGALSRRGSFEEVSIQPSRTYLIDSPPEEGHAYYLQCTSQRLAIKLEFYSSEAPRIPVSLAESLKGFVGISAYVSKAAPQNESPPRATIYLKNGILVGHTGRRITSADVANALAEE